jgi:transaldolase/glucose-6-phosphate isomerase
MNPLLRLQACGQSPWLDFLGRDLITSGALRDLIERDGLKGLTSNPSIFEKAIAGTDNYSHEIKAFQVKTDHAVAAIYEHLAIADIRDAADLLAPVYQESGGLDGFVSLECSPYLAHDTDATVAEGVRLWAAVGRPNLMVKAPATPAGVPAIRRLIGRGINVNVTLLFSDEIYGQVIEAYFSGLEDLARAGGDLSSVASVASFFVSRIDTAVDLALDKLGDKAVAGSLRGKAAIASAKLAHVRADMSFRGPRWEALATAGARPQRLLWASTSAKNPAYRDTMYVEALIGRGTINTLPPATLDAFRDHGVVACDAIEQDIDGARAVLARLEAAGVSLSAICQSLLKDGVRQFSDAFDDLLGAVARKRLEGLEGDHPGLEIDLGSGDLKAAFDAELDLWRRTGGIRRLWAGDAALWTDRGEEKWLGWLNIVGQELAGLETLRALRTEVRQGGFTDLVVLGMGGSSLGPEVLGETFEPQPGFPRFHSLDSTDPAQIAALEAAIDLKRTLFIVSSKSGGTLEPNIFLDYFHARIVATVGEGQSGRHFIAVTDPGSSLAERALRLGFAKTLFGDPQIGGRYSVLSKFGMAPAAGVGVDVERLLKTTGTMIRSCGPDVPPNENPGVGLGAALGVAATRFGRDKVTIFASPGIGDFGAWLEQLLAESTGKEGRGLIPLAGEPFGPPDVYGDDRLFVYLEREGRADIAQRAAIKALSDAGHPVITVTVKDAWGLGGQFFLWEVATAVAGAVIRVNPFDQPDVEASKQKTNALAKVYEATGRFPAEEPMLREGELALYADPRDAAALGVHKSVTAYLRSHLARARRGDYVALLAYLARDPAHTAALTRIRALIRDKTRAATCLGFGPRFQHSTGQVYKGGPNTGLFLQITCDDAHDLETPGAAMSFGAVKAAQARGDFEALADGDRRVLRIHLTKVESGLAALARALEAALD